MQDDSQSASHAARQCHHAGRRRGASIANVAPSSSVAFTLALLVSFAGLASPLAVLLAGNLMFLVAIGYARLNNWTPHAGAPYVWAGTITPVIGYATGLLAILAATVTNNWVIALACV